MRILLLNTVDHGGGAAGVAFNLYRSYRHHGHDARLLVGFKYGNENTVSQIDPYAHTSFWAPLSALGEQWVRRLPKFRGQYRLMLWLRRTAWPRRWVDHRRGLAEFNYPYSYHLLDDPDWRPEVIHAHNLHGNYFDLRALPYLSQQVPVVWTLHDAWAIGGGCAHFVHLNCTPWQSGCAECPLDGPAIATAENWKQKREVYAHSKLAVATPSQWLMDLVEKSGLNPWRTRVIPNGVDLRIFKPSDQLEARRTLRLPSDAFICLFVAPRGDKPDPHKDYKTVEEVVKNLLADVPSRNLFFVCLGGDEKFNGDSRFKYPGHVSEPHLVALYYQAANVLLHAAKVDTFPSVVIEAQACGVPVIASAVGGIPEQVVEEHTGFLIPSGNSDLMAQRVKQLMNHNNLWRQMSLAAAKHAKRFFSLECQVEAYLQWFEKLREEFSME
jgi:glycosyltransferase involved in cell wall biosynthesis